jgi:hypothetical protein
MTATIICPITIKIDADTKAERARAAPLSFLPPKNADAARRAVKTILIVAVEHQKELDY